MIKGDELSFRIYTRHGDSCNCHPYVGRDPIQCASGHHPDDYVLSAAFSFFQDAISQAQRWQAQGVSCKLRSKTGGQPRFEWFEYPAKTPNTESAPVKPYVIITVSGGVAELAKGGESADVDILDFDNIREDYERAAQELSAPELDYLRENDSYTYDKLKPYLEARP